MPKQWTKKMFAQHERAAQLLDKTMMDAFQFIREHPGCTEMVVQKHILACFKERGLVNEKGKPIVAFGKNTGKMHHFPRSGSGRLRNNSLILIDMWARLREKGAPYGDITWMGVKGKILKKQQEVVDLVFKSRDAAISFLRRETSKGTSKGAKGKIPTGAEVDAVSRRVFERAGYDVAPVKEKKVMRKKVYPHGLGHELGFVSPHGNGAAVRWSNKRPLKKHMGYTIEPGIYLQGKYGARSEVDCVILDGKMRLSSRLQRSLVRV